MRIHLKKIAFVRYIWSQLTWQTDCRVLSVSGGGWLLTGWAYLRLWAAGRAEDAMRRTIMSDIIINIIINFVITITSISNIGVQQPDNGSTTLSLDSLPGKAAFTLIRVRVRVRVSLHGLARVALYCNYRQISLWWEGKREKSSNCRYNGDTYWAFAWTTSALKVERKEKQR